MQSIEAAQGIRSVMASEPGHSRLYKKETMSTTVTLEINLVYPWTRTYCTWCKKILMWASPTFCEWGGTNQAARLFWLLVAIVPGDIIECPSLLWPLVVTVLGDINEWPSLLCPWVVTGSCDVQGRSLLLPNGHSRNGRRCDITRAHFYRGL
jgi:hypothetical protein